MLIGWKLLSLSRNDGYLRSPYRKTLWSGNPLQMRRACSTSSCLSKICTNNMADCICGIYSYRDYDFAVAAADHPYVLAQCTLWGCVAEHELGYRSEWCRVEKLFIAEGAPYKKILQKHYPFLLVDSLSSKPIDQTQWA